MSNRKTFEINSEKWKTIQQLKQQVEDLRNEIKEVDPYFEVKVSNQVNITGLPSNSILIVNGEEYKIDGGVSFDGGAKLDFSKIYK